MPKGKTIYLIWKPWNSWSFAFVSCVSMLPNYPAHLAGSTCLFELLHKTVKMVRLARSDGKSRTGSSSSALFLYVAGLRAYFFVMVRLVMARYVSIKVGMNLQRATPPVDIKVCFRPPTPYLPVSLPFPKPITALRQYYYWESNLQLDCSPKRAA